MSEVVFSNITAKKNTRNQPTLTQLRVMYSFFQVNAPQIYIGKGQKKCEESLF